MEGIGGLKEQLLDESGAGESIPRTSIGVRRRNRGVEG
jgi:hypothetical protein